tara:strand:- start:1365 stop:1628 length:264 start_codon:yes stop_codon:yes gene_type:complete
MIIEPFSFIFFSTASFCTFLLILISMILVVAAVLTSRLQMGAFITFFSYFHFIIFAYPGLSIACIVIAMLILFNVFFNKKEEFKNKK